MPPALRPLAPGVLRPACLVPQSNAQLDCAFEYLGKLGAEPLDRAALEEAAGVGVEVTPEQASEVAACMLRPCVQFLCTEKPARLPAAGRCCGRWELRPACSLRHGVIEAGRGRVCVSVRGLWASICVRDLISNPVGSSQ